MSSEIISYVTELKEITTEVKNRSKELCKLRARKVELEKKICDFLTEKDQPGVKYKDVAIILEKNKYKRMPKKKAQKEEDCLNVLKHYGVSNAEKIFGELLETMKGDEVQKNAIRLKDVRSYNNGAINVPISGR
jgi:hypothetical protein